MIKNTKHFNGKRCFSLRLEETRSGQKRLINWAYDFKELK
jgi:hypothetical protein